MARYEKPTAEERAARDEARRSALAQKLIDAVKAIQTSADFIRVLKWQAAFYNYSVQNCMLIMMQRPDAGQVAGFHTWKRLGRTVIKGAKGIMIYAPRIAKGKQAGDDDRLYFGVEHVFSIFDTTGEEAPNLDYPRLDGPGSQAAYAGLLAFARAEGVTVTEVPEAPTSADGYYAAKRQVIYVRPASPAHMLVTLAHELAHHLDRDNKATTPEKETIAEGAAHVFCAHFGLDTGANSYPYIAHWTATEGGEKMILGCLKHIQRIAKAMIDAATPAEADGDHTASMLPAAGALAGAIA